MCGQKLAGQAGVARRRTVQRGIANAATSPAECLRRNRHMPTRDQSRYANQTALAGASVTVLRLDPEVAGFRCKALSNYHRYGRRQSFRARVQHGSPAIGD